MNSSLKYLHYDNYFIPLLKYTWFNFVRYSVSSRIFKLGAKLIPFIMGCKKSAFISLNPKLSRSYDKVFAIEKSKSY